MTLLTTPAWPNGLPLDHMGGVSWADFDQDGWVDIFGVRKPQVWRNRGGKDFELIWVDAIDERYRYGAVCGDYNNDGYPDVSSEPRKVTNERMKLLRNEGDLTFTEMGSQPGVIDLHPHGDAETNTWIDVDFDGLLDLYMPTYGPEHMGGVGHFFLHNQGPTGPNGEYTFLEISGPAGLDEIPGTSRNEGTDWSDLDKDGDPEVFVAGTLYQNISSHGAPLFVDVSDSSGIEMRDRLDEGLCFLDMDLDGDDDLFVLYCSGVEPRCYENLGDGTFQIRPKNWFADKPGSCIDVTNVDFDNDGDIDLTLDGLFMKNEFLETGQRRFSVATTTIPAGSFPNTVFAWADWNRDGDMDLAMGNNGVGGFFYDNDLYGPNTPEASKRHVRVRVVRDSDTFERGLETEYGASVELHLHDEPGRLRRRRTVTSAAGYINQNEYTVPFALPMAPNPKEGIDWTFDVSVDFVSDPAIGLRRVDRHVNPILGGIDLATLTDREIWVYRSGRVRINDCFYEPIGGAEAVMSATTGGLVLVTDQAPLARPSSAPGADWWVGTELDTLQASGAQRIREVIVDGVLAEGDPCSADGARLHLWDVTNPNAPALVGAEPLARYVRNDRGHYRTNLVLEPGKVYRLLARVETLRATPITGPVNDGALTTRGGLSFQDGTACDATEVLAATVDASQVYLSARFSPDSLQTWADLGHAHAGAGGPASLSGSGQADAGATVQLTLSDALPNRMTVLVSSTTAECRPMAGGVLVPGLDVLTPVPTDANGAWSLPVDLDTGLDPGTTVYFQSWWVDASALGGRAGSNALSVTVPY